MKIKIMNEVLANKIAAGEVIERPLSVVKELIENSIDAHSTKIKINLIDSGIKKIEIIDNGDGMSKDDLPLAIKRHATSKLLDDKSLFKIATLGFRGEALPSIYAVSKLQINSSIDGIEGFQLQKIEDDNYKINSIAMNKGTKVIIENLFYNTPVRYKHLSNPFYELSLIVQYINKVSLIHSEISFELNNNNNNLIQTSGKSDVRSVLSKQYSNKIAANMLKIEGENEHFKFELFSSHPHDTRSRKSHITIGLNKRLIRSYEIENKIIESYGTFLHTGQFPIAYINISVNYELIDVNVHPTKQQVKISLIDNLLDLIYSKITEKLASLTYISEPINITTNNYEKVEDVNDNEVNEQLDSLFQGVKKNNNEVINNEHIKLSDNEVFKKNGTNVNYTEDLFALDSTSKKISEHQKLPLFSFVGTLHNTYIVFENGDGLFLVDQHAAQERINYEHIYNMFKNKQFVYQQTLVPIIISLTDTENTIFSEKINETIQFGFKVEPFGINTYKVTEIDSWIANRKSVEEDVLDIVNQIIEKKNNTFEQYFEDVAIMMACKKSIKAHQRVNRSEAETLISTLNEMKQPFTCPHGRPVIVKISTYEIEKMFKRAG